MLVSCSARWLFVYAQLVGCVSFWVFINSPVGLIFAVVILAARNLDLG